MNLQTSFLPPTDRIPSLEERKALLAKLKASVAGMRFAADEAIKRQSYRTHPFTPEI